MSQSGFIAAALLAGLVLFLAARNRLSAYTDVLFGPAPNVEAQPFAGIPVTNIGGAGPDKGGGGGGLPLPGASASAGAANDNAATGSWMSEGEAAVASAAEGAAADAAAALFL